MQSIDGFSFELRPFYKITNLLLHMMNDEIIRYDSGYNDGQAC